MVANVTETLNNDIDTMDERMAYEFYLKLKKRFEVKVDCKMFTNCNYVGNCQCKSKGSEI